MPDARPALAQEMTYAALCGVVLVACLLAAYAMMIVGLGMAGPRLARPGLTVGLTTVLLVIGVAAHLGLGWARGQLSPMWPGLILPLAFCAFHFASFGINPRGWYDPTLLPIAWILSSVCLLGWMVGHAIARGWAPFSPRPSAHVGGRALSPGELALLSQLGTIALTVGLLAQLVLYSQVGLGVLFSANYGDLRSMAHVDNGSLGYFLGIARMLCIVGLTVHVTASGIGAGRVFRHPFVIVVTALYLLLLFLQGDRSEMSGVLFPVLLARHYLVRPIEWRWALVGGALVFMTFSGVKTFRGSKQGSDFVHSAIDRERLAKTADEMGGTLDVVVRTIEIVPDRQPYFMGRTYTAALGRVVPNVILPRGENDIVSSQWITDLTVERYTTRKGGAGFSIVAEAFINFGFLGAPLVLLTMGLLHGGMERWMAGAWLGFGRLCVFVLAEIALLMHVRNTVVIYIRGTVWMTMILGVILLLLLLWRSFAARRHAPA